MSDSDHSGRDEAIDRVAAAADPLPVGAERLRALDRVKRKLAQQPSSSRDVVTTEDGALRVPGDGRPSDSELQSGKVVMDRYVILAPLGQGGMGAVYDAYDPKLSRRVAVKFLRSEYGSRTVAKEGAARLLREAQALAKVSHPNVVEVHDVGEIADRRGDRPGRVFIVLERLAGETLQAWRSRAHSRGEIVAAYLGAARGLAAAHEAGVIHRDVKPSNLMISAEGRVKVVDFGLARDDRPDLDSSAHWPDIAPPRDQLTRPGQVMGTLLYMAPEQHCGVTASAAADQYALCVALAGDLLGFDLFDRLPARELLENKMERRYAGEGLDPLPAWLRRALHRGLAPDPVERFPSMRELVAALEHDPWRWGRRLGYVAVGTAAATALGLGVAEAFAPAHLAIGVTDGRDAVADAAITIDGALLEGGALEVDAGPHTIVVEAGGFERNERIVEVEHGERRELVVPLQRQTGELVVRVEPDAASVFIDGVDHGSRLVRAELPTGDHRVVVRRAGHYRQDFLWDAVAGESEARSVGLLGAVAWSGDAWGPIFAQQWAGDADGDGRQELLQQILSTLSRIDPWRGRERWTLNLPNPSVVSVVDLQLDGISDVIVVSRPEGAVQIAAYDGAASVQPPRALWTQTLPRTTDDDEPLLQALVPMEGGELLVVSPAETEVVSLAPADGRIRWSVALGSPPRRAATYQHGSAQLVAVATRDGMVGLDAATGSQRWSAEHLAVADADAGYRAKAVQAIMFREVEQRRPRGLQPVRVDSTTDEDLAMYSWVGPGLSEVVLIDGATGLARWRYPLPSDVSPSWPRSIWDPGRGRTLFAVPEEKRATVLDLETGTALWRGADLDHDFSGIRWDVLDSEVWALSADREAVVRINPDTGAIVDRAPSHGRPSAPVVHDFDGDGVAELVNVADAPEGRVVEVRRADFEPLAMLDLDPGTGSLTASVDADGDRAPELLFSGSKPAVLRGRTEAWTRRALGPVRASPWAFDVDADGVPEVGIAGRFDRADVVALDVETGRTKWAGGWKNAPPIRRPAIRSGSNGVELMAVHGGIAGLFASDVPEAKTFPVHGSYATPVFVDVDGDRTEELALATWVGRLSVHALPSMSTRWEVELDGPAFGMPLVVDDEAGQPTLIVTTMHGLATRVGAGGDVLWSRQLGTTISHGAQRLPTARPGAVILARRDAQTTLAVVEVDSGDVRWQLDNVASGSAHVADADGDGRFEIYAGRRGGGLVAVDEDGTVLWEAPLGAGLTAPNSSSTPRVATLGPDEPAVVLAGFDDGSLRVVTASDGASRWRYFMSARIEGQPAVFSVPNRARARILVADVKGAVHAVDPPRG